MAMALGFSSCLLTGGEDGHSAQYSTGSPNSLDPPCLKQLVSGTEVDPEIRVDRLDTFARMS